MAATSDEHHRARIGPVRASAYRVPTDADEADGTLAWSATTIVVVRAEVGDVVGLGWTYADVAGTELVHGILASAVEGRDGLDVSAAWQAMQQAVRNVGRSGLVSCAMSAVEIALWDAARRWTACRWTSPAAVVSESGCGPPRWRLLATGRSPGTARRTSPRTSRWPRRTSGIWSGSTTMTGSSGCSSTGCSIRPWVGAPRALARGARHDVQGG